MFEFIRSHNRVLLFILVLLVIPSFVFLGVKGYSDPSGAQQTVAKVAGQSITQAEWDFAHRNQVERLRSQSPGVDLKLLDTPQMKQRALDDLVRERVLLATAGKLNLGASDERLARLFQDDPQFAVLRKPDGTINKELIQSQGMSVAQFEQRLRQDIGIRQVMLGVAGTAFVPAAGVDSALDALLQRREVRVARFEPAAFAAQVQPTDAELKAFFDDPAQARSFDAPEQANVEFVVLDIEAVKRGITVSDADLKSYYEQNAARFSVAEERRASHILIKADAAAPAAERDKAKARAAALLAQLKTDPKRFAELAKANSDDTGSAQKGGDLDWFGRGAMVKPFEEAVFALKRGELSSVVETDFGFHVIELVEQRGGDKKPFEAVQTEIRTEVAQQLAQRKFAESAEAFSNLVYEQADSLKPAADKLGLSVVSATGVRRSPAPGATGPLASPKFLEAVFGGEALKNKRNTEAVEIAPNQLVAGRVTQYEPAHRRPFDEVREEVRALLVAQRATALARQEGEAKLAAWKQGADASAALAAPVVVSRQQPQGLPRAVVEAVLRAPAEPLPAWVGVDQGGRGFVVARIEKLLPRDAAGVDPQQARTQLTQAWAQVEAMGYYEALKQRLRVKVDVKAPADSASVAGN